jgi:hypothetical protein
MDCHDFGLKNAGATYQRAMNLIFHDLLGIVLEIYIDDVVVKSDSMDNHLADLRLALERIRRYGLKMNPQLGPVQSKIAMGEVHEGTTKDVNHAKSLEMCNWLLLLCCIL